MNTKNKPQAEPESPMKAAADALRRKAELEQAHQDGYRDGFKAAQAMLDKPEQPAEEARGVRPTDDALWDQTIEERDRYHETADDLAAQIAAITGVEIGEHSSINDPWLNAMLAADDFIASQIRALLAAPAAGTGQDIPTDSIDRLTRDKAAHIIARDGFQVSGVVMTKPNGSVCIVDKSAVRWLDSRELFRVMHPDAPPAATGAHGLTWISVNDRLPPIGTGERVLIYTEGADFAGEQFFDIKADDLYPTPDGEQDARTEVAAAATHWMPLPYPGITPNQKDA